MARAIFPQLDRLVDYREGHRGTAPGIKHGFAGKQLPADRVINGDGRSVRGEEKAEHDNE